YFSDIPYDSSTHQENLAGIEIGTRAAIASKTQRSTLLRDRRKDPLEMKVFVKHGTFVSVE
ncbi:MAG TPA: hypothetical protein PK343_10530, partial [Giesbergeria sp.]|nr:hypothetical protein [Giesbergeria sp.]